VLDPVAVELRIGASGHAHGIRRRDGERAATESAPGTQQRPGLRRQRPLLDVEGVCPRERGVDRESAARVEDGIVEAPRGDGDAERVGAVVAVAVRPLGHPEVAPAPRVHASGRPRLRAQPPHRRLPVGDLVVQRIERPAGAEGAATALHDHMVPSLGQEERDAGDPVAAVRRADQDRVASGSFRVPVVGEERGAVVRRHPDAGRPDDVLVRLRRHVGDAGEPPVLAPRGAAQAGSIGHRTPFTRVTANAAITAITTAPM
jgi:hypothetical protein